MKVAAALLLLGLGLLEAPAGAFEDRPPGDRPPVPGEDHGNVDACG